MNGHFDYYATLHRRSWVIRDSDKFHAHDSLMETTIPLIDMGPYLGGTPGGRAKVAQKIYRSAHEFSFTPIVDVWESSG